MSYDNRNKGSIWKNEKKEKDTHPDFTGTINVEGTEFWISAWKRKEGASPKSPALSFQVKRKEVPEQVKQAVRRSEDQPEPPKNDFSDDIPW